MYVIQNYFSGSNFYRKLAAVIMTTILDLKKKMIGKGKARGEQQICKWRTIWKKNVWLKINHKLLTLLPKQNKFPLLFPLRPVVFQIIVLPFCYRSEGRAESRFLILVKSYWKWELVVAFCILSDLSDLVCQNKWKKDHLFHT